MLIRAELPHINRNFSREELYAIGTGKMDIGLSAGAQKRINGVIHQAWQWRELARQIKKANKWHKKALPVIAIVAAVVTYGAVSNTVIWAAGTSTSAAISGAAFTL